MKKLLLLPLYLFIFIAFFPPTPAFAQGTYECRFPAYSSTCTLFPSCHLGYVVPLTVNCSTPNACGITNPVRGDCVAAAATATPTPTSTPTPTLLPGKYWCAGNSVNCNVVSPTGCTLGYIPPATSACWVGVDSSCQPEYNDWRDCVAAAATATPSPTATPTLPPGTCAGFNPPLGGCQFSSRCSTLAACPLNRNTCQPTGPTCQAVTVGGLQGYVCTCVVVNVSPLIIRPADCSPAFGSKGINTALGCIPTKLESIVPWLLRALAGVAGGIALLLLFYGGLTYIMAGGEKTGVEEAKGIITAAVSGLLLIIFSILILRIIGINILGIPAITVGPNNGITVPGT